MSESPSNRIVLTQRSRTVSEESRSKSNSIGCEHEDDVPVDSVADATLKHEIEENIDIEMMDAEQNDTLVVEYYDETLEFVDTTQGDVYEVLNVVDNEQYIVGSSQEYWTENPEGNEDITYGDDVQAEPINGESSGEGDAPVDEVVCIDDEEGEVEGDDDDDVVDEEAEDEEEEEEENDEKDDETLDNDPENDKDLIKMFNKDSTSNTIDTYDYAADEAVFPVDSCPMPFEDMMPFLPKLEDLSAGEKRYIVDQIKNSFHTMQAEARRIKGQLRAINARSGRLRMQIRREENAARSGMDPDKVPRSSKGIGKKFTE